MFDLVIAGGRVVDPANGVDATLDVGISSGRIAAVAPSLGDRPRTQTVDARGKLVTPGLIDMHTHVYEYVSHYGLSADRAGLQSGCTTIVDMASAGGPGIHGLRGHVVDRSITDVRAFLNVLATGTLLGWLPYLETVKAPPIHVEETVKTIEANRDLVKGVKVHGEIGAVSRWGYEVIKAGRAIADACKVPIYMHTGHLYPVLGKPPETDGVLPEALQYMKEGDVFGHIFSKHKGSIWTQKGTVQPACIEAAKRGVLFEIGHGNNFVFEVARKVLDAGLRPDILSSDVHGDTKVPHKSDDLDYSMVGTMTKVWALGFDISEVVRMSTVNPARVLRLSDEKGTLGVGRKADVTVLDVVTGDFEISDTVGEKMRIDRKLVPHTTVIGGKPFHLDPSALPELRRHA